MYGNAIKTKCSRNSGVSYTGRPSEKVYLRKKMIGKPYSEKPNVQFNEGELEIEYTTTTPVLYSAVISFSFHHQINGQDPLFLAFSNVPHIPNSHAFLASWQPSSLLPIIK